MNNTTPTELYNAVETGDVDKIRNLLASGVDINSRNDNGRTPLFLATIEGHIDVIRVLLAAGADVDIPDDRDMTPLFIASMLARADIVQALLNAGADPNGKKPPLLSATYWGHTDVVRVLLDAGADPNYAGNNDITPLELARTRGHEDIEELIEKVLKRKEARRTGKELAGLREVVAKRMRINDPGSIMASFLTGNKGRSLASQQNIQKQKSGISLAQRPRMYYKKQGGKRKTRGVKKGGKSRKTRKH